MQDGVVLAHMVGAVGGLSSRLNSCLGPRQELLTAVNAEPLCLQFTMGSMPGGLKHRFMV